MRNLKRVRRLPTKPCVRARQWQPIGTIIERVFVMGQRVAIGEGTHVNSGSAASLAGGSSRQMVPVAAAAHCSRLVALPPAQL